MTFTTPRLFPTTLPAMAPVLCAVYEFERLERKARNEQEFIRSNLHDPSACRRAQRRLDYAWAACGRVVEQADAAQLQALFDLCDVTPAQFGLLR